MISLIANGLKKYNGVTLEPGQAFEVRDQDARVLLLMGKARLANEGTSQEKYYEAARIPDDGGEIILKRKRGRPRKTPVVA